MRDQVKVRIREAIRTQYPEFVEDAEHHVYRGEYGISLRWSANREVELGLGLYADGRIKFYVYSHGAHERVRDLVHHMMPVTREGLGFGFSEPNHETTSCTECFFERQMNWRHLTDHDVDILVEDYAAIVASMEGVGAFI